MTELLRFIAENNAVSVILAYLLFITVCRIGRFFLILIRGWPPEWYDEDWTPERNGEDWQKLDADTQANAAAACGAGTGGPNDTEPLRSDAPTQNNATEARYG